MVDIEKRITEMFSDKDMATFIISSFASLLIVWAFFYFLYKLTFQSRYCSNITSQQTQTLSITDEPTLTAKISDLYIKAAYNCCSLGNYTNDYVGTCILSSILQQGVRYLDFEVFSIDDVPVVATSTSSSYYVKETYNSIPMFEVLTLIGNQAMTGNYAPNPKDPIFLHLRIKSNNIKMFAALNTMLSNLPNVYSGQVKPSTPLSSLMGKIVIIVGKDCKTYISSGYAHNMVSGVSPFLTYNYGTVQTLTPTEMNQMNKPNTMSMLVPSRGSNPANIDLNKAIKMQCNIIAMKYQNATDPLLVNYNTVFAESAFILKSSISVQ